MRIAYFDCFSGASGDMCLAALISAGWPTALHGVTMIRWGTVSWSGSYSTHHLDEGYTTDGDVASSLSPRSTSPSPYTWRSSRE